MQQLTNIDTIFKKKLFRIPDYQRGYAWQLRQLTDFWEDINTLEDGKNHYTGVLSLEETSKSKWSTWVEDSWVIENKGYTPYFIVDGQQRLTTCIILIQALIEEALELPQNKLQNKEDFELCDTKISDIRKDFIFIQRSNSIIRSYIFGYEKDNPSYEFLKTKIFNEYSSIINIRKPCILKTWIMLKSFSAIICAHSLSKNVPYCLNPFTKRLLAIFFLMSM